MQITARFLILNIILLSYVCASFFLSVSAPKDENAQIIVPLLPENIDGWSSRSLDLKDGEIDRDGAIAGARRIYEQNYKSVGVLLIKEESGKRGMHSPANCFTSNGWALDGQCSLAVKVKDFTATLRFRVLNLSKDKEQIISCHTIIYDGASYDSFLKFMLVRVLKGFIGVNKSAYLLRFTSSICEEHCGLSCKKGLCENFLQMFIPAVFNNTLEVKPQIDSTLSCEFSTDGTRLAL